MRVAGGRGRDEPRAEAGWYPDETGRPIEHWYDGADFTGDTRAMSRKDARLWQRINTPASELPSQQLSRLILAVIKVAAVAALLVVIFAVVLVAVAEVRH